MKKITLTSGFILTSVVCGILTTQTNAGTYESCSAQYGEYQNADMMYQWADGNLPSSSIPPYRRAVVQKRRTYELCMML